MSDAPSLPQEIADRKADRDKIAAMFRANELRVIPVHILQAVTPNYHQRISECRRELRMDIRNVPVYIALADGKTKRLAGNYKFHPTLGSREGTQPSVELWPVPDSPFANAEVFKLKP